MYYVFGMYFRIRVLKLWSKYIEIIIQIGSLFELKKIYLFYSGKKRQQINFYHQNFIAENDYYLLPSFITLM